MFLHELVIFSFCEFVSCPYKLRECDRLVLPKTTFLRDVIVCGKLVRYSRHFTSCAVEYLNVVCGILRRT
jgi:hypothetical protein